MKIQVRYQYQIKGHPGGTITTRTIQVPSKTLSALGFTIILPNTTSGL